MGALSVVLIAVGAILTFALERDADGVNLDTVGIILMVVGAIGLIASVVRGSWLGFSSTRTRRVSPDGRTVVERDRVSGY
jgi:glucose uptake protein GlcU